MSVVIIGGNERMEQKYKEVCKLYNYKAKIFTKTNGSLKNKLGEPDLMVLFTNTVSHKMLQSAIRGLKGTNTKIERCNSSSITALKNLFESSIIKSNIQSIRD